MQEDFSKYNAEGTTLRRAQLRMLEILMTVDGICRRHGIEYWLDGGTCLGAVRHGGFIPWDDDLDIGLMRKDYLRLCKILREELPSDMVLQDASSDPYYPCKWAKVRDRNSFFEDPTWNPKVKEQGVFIDIFPMECGNADVKAFVEATYGRAFRRLRHQTSGKGAYVAACAMWPFACAMVAVLRLWAWIFPSDNLIYGYGVSNLRRYYLRRSEMSPAKPIMFEGQNVTGPGDPDAYLKRVFGDYMRIPPVEKRRVHASGIIFHK